MSTLFNSFETSKEAQGYADRALQLYPHIPQHIYIERWANPQEMRFRVFGQGAMIPSTPNLIFLRTVTDPAPSREKLRAYLDKHAVPFYTGGYVTHRTLLAHQHAVYKDNELMFTGTLEQCQKWVAERL